MIKDQFQKQLTAKGLSHYWLAEAARRAGVCSPNAVYDYLSGRKVIAVETAAKLATLIDCQLVLKHK